jgi:pimeloyl-ACP methyl ester carboxylesterase
LPPTSRTVQLGTGLRTHYLEWDAPGDHTLLLIHGFLDFAWTWEPLVAAGISERFHVIAPDLRGHGDSDRVGAGGYYHFPDYLADVAELIEKTARARLSIVGHSMGGSVAAYYTGTYPSRVHRLALLEGTGPPDMPPIGPERIAGWLESWKRVRETPSRSFASIEEAAARLRQWDALLDADLARQLAARGTVAGPDGRVRFKHDPVHATTGPFGFQVEWAMRFWRKITCPVLLVDGGASSFRHPPAEAERRAGAFVDVRRMVLDGAGHMMQRHRPVQLARALLDFLES